MGRFAQALSELNNDGYFEVMSLPNQSYLAVYVANQASQDSDSLDGYEFEVLGLLDSGRNREADHSNWFILADNVNSTTAHPVNSAPRIFDVSGCSRARVHLLTASVTPIVFRGYTKGG